MILLQLIERVGMRHLYKHLKYKHPILFEKITTATSTLVDAKFSERIYGFVYNLQDRPRCLHCGRQVKYKGFATGYAMYCGHSCVAKAELTKERIENTFKTKHGVNGPAELRWRNK